MEKTGCQAEPESSGQTESPDDTPKPTADPEATDPTPAEDE